MDKNVSFIILFACTAFSCSPDIELSPEPKQVTISVSGEIVNSYTAEGMANKTISFYEYYFWFGEEELLGSTSTDQNGNFSFNKSFTRTGTSVGFEFNAGFRENFQRVFSRNGDIAITNNLNVSTSSDSETINIGFFPKTDFRVRVKDVMPLNPNAVINLTLNNVDDRTQLLSQTTGKKAFTITRDTIILGECQIENLLGVEYSVSENGNSSLFLMDVECNPSVLTEVLIEY